MDTVGFEKALRAEGYADVESKGLPPGQHNDAHAHPFDVRALVLEGQIALSVPFGAQALNKKLGPKSYLDARQCLDLPTMPSRRVSPVVAHGKSACRRSSTRWWPWAACAEGRTGPR